MVGLAFSARAVNLSYQAYCVPCGYHLLGPLSGRTVAPDHRIEIEAACSDLDRLRFPQLRLSDGSYWETYWVEAGEGSSGDLVLSPRRFERVGPDLPAGAVIELGALGPRHCWEDAGKWNTHGSLQFAPCTTREQGGVCCGEITESHFVPVARFEVGPADATSVRPDAGAEPDASASLDSSAAGVLDAGAATSDPSAEAGVSADGGQRTDAVQALAWRMRCTENGAQRAIFLDLAGTAVPDHVLRIDLLSQKVASFGNLLQLGTRWDAELCSGGQPRSFLGRNVPMRQGMFSEEALADGRHTYQVLAYGEGDVVARTSELELDVPGDCVAPESIALDWHQLTFAVRCRESNSAFDRDSYPEMSVEFSSPGACLPAVDPNVGSSDIIVPLPEQPLPVVELLPVPAASTPPAATSPSSGLRSSRRPDAGSCTLGAVPAAGRRPVLLAALTAIAWSFGLRRRSK